MSDGFRLLAQLARATAVLLATLTPLGFGGAPASGAVAGAGRVAWTENGVVYVAREGGRARRVARGSAAGIEGSHVAYLEQGVLYIGARRIALRGAADARFGGGRVLWQRRRADGSIEVLIGRRVVSVVGGHRPYVQLGQIDARHAVWTEGRDNAYVVVEDGRAIPGPAAYRTPQFGAAVAPDGTLFLGRSAIGCGERTSIVRRAHGRTTTLLRLPRGEDFDTLWWSRGALYVAVVDCSARTVHLAKLSLRSAR